MKKLLTSIVFIICAVSVWAQDEIPVRIGDLYYNLNEDDGTAEVTYLESYFESGSAKPSYSGLDSVTIPSYVKHEGLFYEVTSIGMRAFHWSDIKSITIPNSITRIEDSAFFMTYNLKSIIIPSSVRYIGDGAFWDCDDLRSIKIRSSAIDFGNDVFYGCNKLDSICVPIDERKHLLSTRKLQGLENKIFEVEFTPTADEAELTYYIDNFYYQIDFENKTASLTHHIPTTKWDDANYNCQTTAQIPSSITYRGTTYTVTSIGDLAFSGCTNLRSVTIPNSVTHIGDNAFRDCSALNSIAIPNSVTSIGSSAFTGCDMLKSPICVNRTFAYLPKSYSGAYTIPDSIETIAGGAFSGCNSLTSVKFSNSVTSIGEYAFGDCSSLASIEIPNSIICIGDFAFSGCTGLTSPLCVNRTFAYLPESYTGAYTIPEGIETIAGGAFGDCKSLTSVTIPNSVKNICNGAFYDCEGLTSIIIPNSVTIIGEDAFRNCERLSSIIIPNSVTSIGDHAFDNCSSLSSVIIPNNVTKIEKEVFSGCCSLTSVTIPNSVTKIGDLSFTACFGLTAITIPNSVTSIGNGAFWGCKGLTSVTIPSSVTCLGDMAFINCSDLASVSIGNSVKSIGEYAFGYCSSLTSVTISNSITNFGYRAFFECKSLRSVTCYSTVPPKLEKSSNPLEATLYVPIGFGEIYRNSLFGKQFSKIEEIYVKPSILLSKELESSNEQVAKIVYQRNEVISHSPYAQYLNETERNRFIPTYSHSQIPDAYDYNRAKAFCDSLQRAAEALSLQDPVTPIKDYLRTTRPDDFVLAYFQENPAEKEHLGGEYIEYRCHYASFTDFVIQYEQGRLQPSERNCRELKWQEYREYYSSREAFDSDYDKSDEHIEAHKRREIKWTECTNYYASRELFDIDYNQGDSVISDYLNRIDQAWSALQNLPEKVLISKNLQGADENTKEDIVNLVSLYHQLDPSPTFQHRAADFLISSNKKMGKEYEKHGEYFSSKTNFISAYFSKDYKQILKSKK